MKCNFISSILLCTSLTFTSKAQHQNFLSLDGVDDYARVYANNSVYDLQTGSVCFWLRLHTVYQTPYLFSVTDLTQSGSASDNFAPIFANNVGNQIRTNAFNASSIIHDSFSPTNTLNDTAWHHLCFVADNTGLLKLYVDGQDMTLTDGFCCGAYATDVFFGDAVDVNSMHLGVLKTGSGIIANKYLAGDLDDFMVWNIALSPSQVYDLKNDLSLPPLSNRLVYYDFESISDLSTGAPGVNDIQDMSGNGFHADLYGTPALINSISNPDQTANTFSLFPNPLNSTVFTIYFPKSSLSSSYSLKIYNTQGQLAYSSQVQSFAGASTQIDLLNPLAKGVYTLSLTAESGSVYQQLLVIL